MNNLKSNKKFIINKNGLPTIKVPPDTDINILNINVKLNFFKKKVKSNEIINLNKIFK